MPNISFLLKHLSPTIINRHISYSELANFEGVMILRGPISYSSDYLHIADSQELPTILIDMDPKKNITIITSGDFGDLSKYRNISHVNLIATSLDLFELYEKINRIVTDYRSWYICFMKSICEEKTPKHLIDEIGSKINAPVLLLDKTYRLICAHQEPLLNDLFIEEVFSKGMLTPSSVLKLVGKDLKTYSQGLESVRFFSSMTPNTYDMIALTYNDNVFAHLIIVTDSRHDAMDIPYLTTQLSYYVKKLLSCKNEIEPYVDTVFSKLMEEIIELEVTTLEDIEERLKLVKYPLNLFNSCVVVHFNDSESSEIPYNFIVSQLEQIFPKNNITIYQGDIIILMSYETRTWELDLGCSQLISLLKQYDAFAGISNGTRDRSKIRTLYLIAKSTVQLGMTLRKNKEERFFTHEEYSMYCIIDLCAKHFNENYKHNDIIYLSHPAIIALLRHDQKHNNNLVDILFHYLINDSNIIKTSKALYMHRNTVTNKIKKISEIIGVTLDDGQLQLRLLFSCLLVKYYKDYMRGSIV